MELKFNSPIQVLEEFIQLLEYAKESGYLIADVPYYVNAVNPATNTTRIVTNLSFLYIEKCTKKKVESHKKPNSYLEYSIKKDFSSFEKCSIFDMLAKDNIDAILTITECYDIGSLSQKDVSFIKYSLLAAGYCGIYNNDNLIDCISKLNKALAILNSNIKQ